MLTGCAGEAAPGETSVGLDLSATWLDGGRMLAVVTEGSSTCVPSADEATFADGVITVTLVDAAPDQPCTKDLVPRATLVGVPTGVDPAQGVTLDVTYGNAVGSTDVAAAEGLTGVGSESDFVPDAAWLPDGSFALVTWGSSSCVPVVQELATTAEKEVTVTFETPPADRVCTLDYAPRVTLATPDGLTDRTGVELVLQGDTFAGTRVPVR